MVLMVLKSQFAEGAGGPRAVKYGTTKDYVCGLEVVFPSGDIVQMGGKLVKNVTGYSLMQLLVGSEGTLAVATKIILRRLLDIDTDIKTGRTDPVLALDLFVAGVCRTSP